MCYLTKLKDKLCFESMTSDDVQSESSEIKVKKYILWLVSLFLLTTSCLTPVFVNSTFATRPNLKFENDSYQETLKTSLNVTVYKDFDYDVGDFNWLKVVFFAGFGISHFTIGFVGDIYGKWKIFNYSIKVLIASELVLIITSKSSISPNMKHLIIFVNFDFREYL